MPPKDSQTTGKNIDNFTHTGGYPSSELLAVFRWLNQKAICCTAREESLILSADIRHDVWLDDFLSYFISRCKQATIDISTRSAPDRPVDGTFNLQTYNRRPSCDARQTPTVIDDDTLQRRHADELLHTRMRPERIISVFPLTGLHWYWNWRFIMNTFCIFLTWGF